MRAWSSIILNFSHLIQEGNPLINILLCQLGNVGYMHVEFGFVVDKIIILVLLL